MNNHSLLISKVINGGWGLGRRDDGRLAMVRYTLPGERVTVSLEEARKDHDLCRLRQIDQASASRVAAPCPYYGDCGGCDLQHASYDEQLRLKQDIALDLLTRQFAGPETPELACGVEPTLASPCALHYRQRIRLLADRHGAECGFRRYRSHDIVAIERCLIAREELNQALAALRALAVFRQLLALTAELELLFNPDTARVTALFHLRRKPRPADFGAAADLLAAVEVLERVFFQGEHFPLTPAAPKDGGNRLSITYPAGSGPAAQPLVLGWEVGGFCQVNLEQNLQLIGLAVELAEIGSHDRVLDLFCGMGNFSVPLARRAHCLLGLEGQGAAIRSARENSALAGLVNTTFRKAPIHAGALELIAAGERFDCLVVDPPRQGIPGLAGRLHEFHPRRLVYISCDPATLCRDLVELCVTGFIIKKIQPVDMFPQTHHVETVVLLEKN